MKEVSRMSETVKLIIEIPRNEYEYTCNMTLHDRSIWDDAIRKGIPLDDVKTEIGQFREALAEKAPSLRDLINAQQTIDICLGFIDECTKGE